MKIYKKDLKDINYKITNKEAVKEKFKTLKRKEIKKILDRIWSKAIRTRASKGDGYAEGNCECCGMYRKLQAHHIYTRDRLSTRWDLDNGLGLCAGCHTLNSNLSAHKAPRAFFNWLESKKGKNFVDDLQKKSLLISKQTKEDLFDIYIELKDFIKKIRNK